MRGHLKDLTLKFTYLETEYSKI